MQSKPSAAEGRFKLVHDTFHHHLAGGGPIFPEHTGIVHISGVVDPALKPEEMQDGHRILVDADDRLGNIEQIRALLDAGYDGAFSYEPFSPEVHAHCRSGAGAPAKHAIHQVCDHCLRKSFGGALIQFDALPKKWNEYSIESWQGYFCSKCKFGLRLRNRKPGFRVPVYNWCCRAPFCGGD